MYLLYQDTSRQAIASFSKKLMSRFLDLSDRIDDLHFRFIPILDPTGTYSDAEYDRMRAFRLLAHAEIERYLELLLEDAVARFSQQIAIWQLAAQSQSVLVRRLTVHLELEIRSLIKKNNGAKKDNILTLLKPLGINGSQLDNLWLEAMDTYGTVRGNFAHNANRATQLLDPKTEQDLLYRQLLPELRKLEILVLTVI
jgi:hypothetical protein